MRQRLLEHQQHKARRSGGDAAAARIDRIGRDHARRRVREASCVRTGGQDLRQDVLQPPREAIWRDQLVKALHHASVKAAVGLVICEHTRGLAHADDHPAGQQVVDIDAERHQPAELRDMLLAVQNRLIEVGNAPSLRNVVSEARTEDGRGLRGDGVAPRPEGRDLLEVTSQHEIAVHHAGNADGAHAPQRTPQLPLGVLAQRAVAGAHSRHHVLKMVDPYAVFHPVFPAVASGRKRRMIRPGQNGLDAGGAELNADRARRKINVHGKFLLAFAVLAKRRDWRALHTQRPPEVLRC